MPFLLAQLTDPHIGATWVGDQSVAGLEKAVEAIRQLPNLPDVVLVSGDLADSGKATEYDVVKTLTTALGAPVYVLPGNRDDRSTMRTRFDLPGQESAPVQYSVDLGPLRLIVLDSTKPGQARGELDRERLAWLDEELRLQPERLTLVTMHHLPVATGMPAWDEIGLPAADRNALAEILGRHPQVERIVTGHVHRPVFAWFAGRPVVAAPSTYARACVSFAEDGLDFVPAQPAFALHAVVDGHVSTQVEYVD
jgi:3',5'-cyclic-AMP phosphodiesterase